MTLNVEGMFSIHIFSFKNVVLIVPDYFEIQSESEWMQSLMYILRISRVSFSNCIGLSIYWSKIVSSFVCCGYLPFFVTSTNGRMCKFIITNNTASHWALAAKSA